MEEAKKRIKRNLIANIKSLNKKIDSGYINISCKKFILNYDINEWLNSKQLACGHCGIKQSLLAQQVHVMPDSKRKRGRTLEVDRINHDIHYTKENIQFACYWCNNSRANQFTNDEFRSIGKAIGKALKLKLTLLMLLFACISYSQSLTKLTEYDDDNRPKFYKYVDEKLEVKAKEILDYYGKVACRLNYTTYPSYFKLQTSKFLYDQEKGEIIDKESNNLHLKFLPKIGYSGLQTADGVVVNYKNGAKNGRYIQADRVITGSKQANISRVDVDALQRNVIKWYTDVESEPTYTIYNGYVLNFKNGLLDGTQKSTFYNGAIRFLAHFKNGKPVDYLRNDEHGNIISTIKFKDGVTIGKYIINGKIYEQNAVILFSELQSAGNLSRINVEIDEYGDHYIINEGSGRTSLGRDKEETYYYPDLFNCPRFRIKKLDTDLNDEQSLNIFYLSSKFTNDEEFLSDSTDFAYRSIWDSSYFKNIKQIFSFQNPLRINRELHNSEISKEVGGMYGPTIDKYRQRLKKNLKFINSIYNLGSSNTYEQSPVIITQYLKLLSEVVRAIDSLPNQADLWKYFDNKNYTEQFLRKAEYNSIYGNDSIFARKPFLTGIDNNSLFQLTASREEDTENTFEGLVLYGTTGNGQLFKFIDTYWEAKCESCYWSDKLFIDIIKPDKTYRIKVHYGYSLNANEDYKNSPTHYEYFYSSIEEINLLINGKIVSQLYSNPSNKKKYNN